MRTIGILLLTAFAIHGAETSAATGHVAEGFRAFYNLDYDAAISEFDQAIAADPADPELHSHVAQALLYRELYRNGSLETQLVSGNNSFLRRPKLVPAPDVEKRFFLEIDKALKLAQARLAQNPKDTFALHASSVAKGLRANYYFLVKKAWKEALSDATEARRLDTRVSEIDPNFVDARMIEGIHDYVVGSLPWAYRTLGFLAGFHGDKQKGLKLIEQVYQNGKADRVEAQIILCVLYRRENQSRRAIPLLEDLIRKYPQNYLLRFELSQMYSLVGDRVKALSALDEVATLKQGNAPGYERVPWEKIWFQKGNLQFWFDDLDRALENLKKVTATTRQVKELDLNTGVLAYMRQGQIYDLKRQHEQALKEYELAIDFAPEADAARESKHYMTSPYDRNTKWRP